MISLVELEVGHTSFMFPRLLQGRQNGSHELAHLVPMLGQGVHSNSLCPFTSENIESHSDQPFLPSSKGTEIW